MRLAVLAAEQAAGAVLDAIARRIADGGLGRFDDELELAARTAAVASVAAAVGAELVAAEMQGKAHLLHLDAAELDAAGGLPLASTRPAVARRRAAAAGARLEQMPDERLLGARVDALHGHAEAPAPACHRPLGACRRQRADDRLDDLLAAVVGAQRHRRAGSRPDDGALLELQLQRPKGAIVLRNLGIDQVGERHHRRGMGVGVGRS